VRDRLLSLIKVFYLVGKMIFVGAADKLFLPFSTNMAWFF